jgi:hypothetical protein
MTSVIATAAAETTPRSQPMRPLAPSGLTSSRGIVQRLPGAADMSCPVPGAEIRVWGVVAVGGIEPPTRGL